MKKSKELKVTKLVNPQLHPTKVHLAGSHCHPHGAKNSLRVHLQPDFPGKADLPDLGYTAANQDCILAGYCWDPLPLGAEYSALSRRIWSPQTVLWSLHRNFPGLYGDNLVPAELLWLQTPKQVWTFTQFWSVFFFSFEKMDTTLQSL